MGINNQRIRKRLQYPFAMLCYTPRYNRDSQLIPNANIFCSAKHIVVNIIQRYLCVTVNGRYVHCIKSQILEKTNTTFTLEKTNIKYPALYLY